MNLKSLVKHKGDKILTAGAKSYQYDAAGRTTRVTAPNGITNIAYDWESRISSINGPGITASYTYNGLDTRVSKLENGQSQTFVRDGAYVTDLVLRDTSAAYTPGNFERRNGVSTWNYSGLKSQEVQTNASNNVSAKRTYDAFGNLVSSTGTWSGPFGYAGGFGYQEDASGLKLLGHRYNDSSTGRFLTRDPIKDGKNLFVYCESNPVVNLDADGCNPLKFAALLMISLATAATLILTLEALIDMLKDAFHRNTQTRLQPRPIWRILLRLKQNNEILCKTP